MLAVLARAAPGHCGWLGTRATAVGGLASARGAARGLGAAAEAAAALRLASAGNLVRFVAPTGGVHWGTLVEPTTGQDEVRAQPLEADADLLAGPTGWKASACEPLPVAGLLAPLPVSPPPAIICLGLNYHAHAKETGMGAPRFPVMFYKSPASVAAPGQPVVIPDCARAKPEVDFESELAFVVSRPTRDATLEEALGAVLGVTAANDVSARRWQGKKGGGQWSYSKSFDGFCPLGPSLAPMGAGAGSVGARLAAGGDGLRLRGFVNGQEMQDSSTSDMIFTIAEVVRFLSDGTTLLPGTLVLTGTPCGVGFARKPPSYLAPGDEVTVELEGVGALSNRMA